MAQAKPDRPDVATYGDHEVITPVNKLAKAVTRLKAPMAGDDPIARAEQALANLSNEFATWMHQESDRLDRARKTMRASGLTPETCDPLYRAAHDIKGEAQTLGFQHVAPAALSLCRLLEHTPDLSRIPLELVDQHVDAMRAIIREHARVDIVAIATALTRRLRQVTEEFLIVENRHRPDYLAGTVSPPLAPGE